MWVNRQYYESLKRHVEVVQANHDRMYADVTRLEERLVAEIDRLKGARDADRSVYEARERELVLRTLNAEKRQAVAQAYFDTLRVEVNRLRMENATLLSQLLPNARFVAPQTERTTFDGPGLSFDDMGDEAAKVMGLADEIPVLDQIVGTPRQPTPEL